MVFRSVFQLLPFGQRMKVFLGASALLAVAYIPLLKKENIQHENMDEMREYQRAQAEKAAAAAAEAKR